VRIQLDPRELARRKIGLDQVLAAVADNNVSLPTGTLWGPAQAVNIQADGGAALCVRVPSPSW